MESIITFIAGFSIWPIIIFIIGLVIVVTFWKSIRNIFNWRVVVRTNEVHINQSGQGTIAYGRGLDAGNVYYSWPTWIPKLGITTIILPTSIFDIALDAYDAYDIGRLPFTVDIKAFFQINEAETAAQRIESFNELRNQLKDVLRGSIRTILGGSDIQEILSDRSVFGNKFTKEVKEQLKSWGVDTVKHIEFMDIRDTHDSHVVENIMAKKKSFIEMESRTEIAINMKDARLAEIDAERESEIRKQDAEREVGEKNAEKDKLIGIANETTKQEIQESARTTAIKTMAVIKVNSEEQAEIDKSVATINAEKDKALIIIGADGELEEATRQREITVIAAKATLSEQEKQAEGIEAIGLAEAEADKAMKMAPITAQIALAKEIGSNEGYQKYLLGIKELDVELEVGLKKAEALKSSDLKIISNSGNVDSGMKNIMDVFTTDGGMKVGGMLEAFNNTEIGKIILSKLTDKNSTTGDYVDEYNSKD